VRIASPSAAQKLGIGQVHQEIALCPDISVAENIFMAATNLSRAPLVDYADLKRRAGQILSELGDIDPSALVASLSISQQQLVEIAKALTLDCRVLILDEPTAALTEREAQALFAIMHRLANRGIAIIYISHRMAEIFDHCDRVSVFRDGQYVVTQVVAETTPTQVVNAMVGRELDARYPAKASGNAADRDVILEVSNLSSPGRFHDVSFTLRRGEILGLGGLIGAGRSEIVKGICRIDPHATGEVRLEGKPLRLRRYQQSIDEGLVYLSEDRKGDGLFLDLSIEANVSALKLGSLAHPVSSLSGGNQQKVAIAKMLSVNPKVIFLDEPTRGVDVGAKLEIHRILRDLAEGGVGIVVISSELPELIGACDRVLVVREGRINGEVAGDTMTEQHIMHLASISAEQALGGVS
jgi:ribose transport system ATP-binding protein